MQGLRIGYALTGSFCTFSHAMQAIRELVDAGAQVTPILSFPSAALDTRFGTAASWKEQLRDITGRKPLQTLVEVEPIGPQKLFDVMAVAPCTGSTLARLANGLSDTPVTLGVKSHLRRGLPVVLAISTNDALGASLRNIALLKNAKHVYLTPMRQDDPENKPNSLVADFSKVPAAIAAALEGRQLQPILF